MQTSLPFYHRSVQIPGVKLGALSQNEGAAPPGLDTNIKKQHNNVTNLIRFHFHKHFIVS
jgi:hypothetical protein